MNIKDLLKSFTVLNEKNDRALNLLAKITVNPAAELTKSGLKQLFDDIMYMYTGVVALSQNINKNHFYKRGKKTEFFSSLEKRIDFISEKSLEKLALASFNADNSDYISPNVKKRLYQSIAESMDSIKPDVLAMNASRTVSMEDIVSSHELIRYLHQLGTELFFDPNREKWEWNSVGKNTHLYSGSRVSLRMMSITHKPAEDYLKDNPFLKRMIEIDEKKKFYHQLSSPKIFALINNDLLSIQFQLGCHFATLQIREIRDGKEAPDYNFRFRWVDTVHYHTSKFRSNVSADILRKLGYRVNRCANIMEFNADIPTKDAVDEFEILLRFLSSMKDLDTCDSNKVKGRLSDVVQAFNRGVIPLAKYVADYNHGTYKSVARNQNSYMDTPIFSRHKEKKRGK